MANGVRNPSTDALFDAILSLETKEECYMFFEDLCTIKEVQDIAQRLEVAFMLDEGKNYQEISKATGASTATISRVKKCLIYGSGGYRTALDRAKEEGEK
jgi:TrpR-related protein YerC/YecD